MLRIGDVRRVVEVLLVFGHAMLLISKARG